MSKPILNVSLAFDEKYTRFAYVCIYSLLTNNAASNVHLYILQYDLTDESRLLLLNLAKQFDAHIEFLYVKKSLFSKRLPITNKWPIEVYFRLLLTDLLPKEVDRIIYLDSDIIVNGSLTEMYNTDMAGYNIAGCYDLSLITANLDMFLYYRHKWFAKQYSSKTYINSGAILMDMNKLRKSYPLEVYLDAAKELDYKIYAPDQDLINYVHNGKIKLLDPRKYNYPAYLAYTEDIREKFLVTIMHFIGKKPWQGGNHAHFFTERFWWEYAFLTPFAWDLMKQFMIDSMTDTTILEELSGTDQAKASLILENSRLKKELENATEQVKRVIALFENNSK